MGRVPPWNGCGRNSELAKNWIGRLVTGRLTTRNDARNHLVYIALKAVLR
jgi:hypothetical protein